MVDESHMAVVYCLSSSGALSLRSNVSIATRTLDTWLGLSERANQRQTAYNTVFEHAHKPLNMENYMNTIPTVHSIKFIQLYSWARSSISVFVQKLQQHSNHISEHTIGKIYRSTFGLIWLVLQLTGSQLEYD